MKTDTADKILGIIKKNNQIRVHDLTVELGIGNVAIHRQLKKLQEKGLVKKIGTPPRVFYKIDQTQAANSLKSELQEKVKVCIEENYLYISPIGEMLYGIEGFYEWAKRTKQDKKIGNLANEYCQTIEDAKKFLNIQGWIDGTAKIANTFAEKYIDRVLYADFYSLPKFGKTKLGNLMLYSKQSQNKELIQLVTEKTKDVINKIIQYHNIDAVAFIPPSVPRILQFQKEFQKQLNLNLHTLDLIKIYGGPVVVAQKTLPSKDERIQNAKETIFLKQEDKKIKNILLIDDAVGSGATMNETAKKLKEGYNLSGKVIGFAVVGSYKGFEVIREV